MGKRYYCDYCDKSMVDAPSIIKTHNNGIIHQKFVQEHYQKYKDPEQILSEESMKKPCTRFINGQCQFGSICRFSHYSRDEINALKELVESKNGTKPNMVYPSFIELVHNILNEKTNRNEEISNGNTILCDDNGLTHVFPWTYNNILDSYGDNLPPSVRRLKIEDFNNGNIISWM